MTFSAFQSCVLLVLGMLWPQGARGQDTKLQDEPGFIGWFIDPTTTQGITDPLTWQTSGTHAAGCSDTRSCTFATNCAGNSLTYDDGSSIACNQCRTMKIYETSPFGGPTAVNLFCAEVWNANTVYRQFPESAKATETSSASGATSTISTTEASETGSPTAAATSESESKPGQVWIAGAVIGPLALVAIIAGLLVWRRKRKQASLPQQPPPGSWQQQQPPPMWQQQQPVQMYYVPQQPPQELDIRKEYVPHELDSSNGHVPHEMDGGVHR